MNYNQNEFNEDRVSLFLPLLSTAIVIAVFSAGCNTLKSLPPGTQLQSSTFGLKFAPAAPDGTPLALGSHSTIITTAQPADAGVNLNRFEAKASRTDRTCAANASWRSTRSMSASVRPARSRAIAVLYAGPIKS